MSTIGALFLALVVLYLLDCVVVVPDDALVLVEERDRHWRVVDAGFALGALRQRLVFVSALRPHAGIAVIPGWTVALAPTGLVFRDATGHSRVLRFEALSAIQTYGESVRCGLGTLRVHSPRRARWLARIIATLSTAPAHARAQLIDAALTELTSIDSVTTRVRRYRSEARWLPTLGALLFLHLFAMWPLAVGWLGLHATWAPILAELALLLVLIGWRFVRARRALVGADGEREIAPVVTLALSPPAATRATSLLARDLLGDVHPITTVLALCRERDSVALAARAWRDARFARRATASPEEREIEDWFAARWQRHLERLITHTVTLHHLPTAPARDGASGSYCPRCWTQYSGIAGTCTDCEGVSLMAFAS